MTNLPAVSPQSMDDLARVGQWLAISENGTMEAGKGVKGAEAALRLFFVRELGLPPSAAKSINVRGGNFIMGADLLRALAKRGGYRVMRVDVSDTTCTARLVDSNGLVAGESTFTIEDAKKAGLAGKDNWKNYPSRMLWARASKNVIVDFAPEVALGILLDDEVQEIQPLVDAPTHDAEVHDEEDIPWPDALVIDEETTLAELAGMQDDKEAGE